MQRIVTVVWKHFLNGSFILCLGKTSNASAIEVLETWGFVVNDIFLNTFLQSGIVPLAYHLSYEMKLN